MADKPVQKGDRFRTTRDLQINALTQWSAPMTAGFETTLTAGLELVALDDANDDWNQYPGIALVPKDYKGWEAANVPKQDLALKGQYHGYSGYYFVLDVNDIGDSLEPLPGKADLPDRDA